MIKNFNISLFIPIIFTIFISIFFIPTITNYPNLSFYTPNSVISSNLSYYSHSFLWPTPGYSKITSNFGYRNAPTNGAGTYHGGIDIGAPENSSIVSIADGFVSYIGWYGANGYTVIINHANNYKSIYGHISPVFLVSTGDSIKKGDLIAKVGPKYIEKKNYTTYIDKNGRYTNGATTRSSSSFCN